jgi:branched-chain amino acid transport system permease protein
VLSAIRSNELAVLSMGRNSVKFKNWAFFISAAFSGLAGLLYASYISYIDPTSFTIDESIFILVALFIGGTGNVKGPIAGALFVVLVPEILRFVGLPNAVEANLRQIIYGFTLVLVMNFRPQGLWGKPIK